MRLLFLHREGIIKEKTLGGMHADKGIMSDVIGRGDCSIDERMNTDRRGCAADNFAVCDILSDLCADRNGGAGHS